MRLEGRRATHAWSDPHTHTSHPQGTNAARARHPCRKFSVLLTLHHISAAAPVEGGRRGGCRYPRWAAVLRPRLRGHERRVPRGPRPFTTHVTLSHPTYPPRLSRNRVGFLMHNLILSHEFAAGGRRPPCPVAQSVSQSIRGPSICTTATAPYPLHTSPTPLPAHPVFTRLAWLGGRRARDDPP